MPRPRHANGRPGTRVIPTDWSTNHARVIAGTWTAAGHIYGPRTAGTNVTVADDLTINAPTAPDPIYTGPMRVQQLNGQEARDVIGDQEQITVAYLVVLDRGTVVPLRSVIHLTEVTDPALVGRRLVVRKVGKGSEIWERDLYAVEDQTAPDPD